MSFENVNFWNMIVIILNNMTMSYFFRCDFAFRWINEVLNAETCHYLILKLISIVITIILMLKYYLK